MIEEEEIEVKEKSGSFLIFKLDERLYKFRGT